MESLFAIQYSYLIPLLPLLGAAIAGLLGARYLRGQSHWPIWLGVGASAALSLSLLWGMIQRFERHEPITPGAIPAAANERVPVAPWPYVNLHRELRRVAASVDWYTWIEAGPFQAKAGFWIDALTAVMLSVVTGIGFLITIFSKGYMAGEKGYFRFFAYLGLFIFSMTMLVMGNNFVLLYLGWEGVGLCSYLLIGYYYEKPAAREAAKKAFLVNRVGDFGFALGIMLIYVIFGTVSYFGDLRNPGALIRVTDAGFIATLEPWKAAAIGWIPFLLMVGAFGKSAQFPLYVWLPDAMEGPTPVSALIHAATMVTAGVYMIARCSTLFLASHAAMWTVAIVGAFTALFAATIALRQFDLKKVFAYSTISQLGFMFVAVGVLAPVAAIFHLVTHAFFKALLFLSSGVVMHAMAGELDMRRMSGLKRVLPLTRWFMLAGCLALAGMIPFSGFWSKDEIVIGAFDHSILLGIVLLFTALLTAYYTFRLYFRVFEGPEVIPAGPAHGGHDAAHDDHAHASASALQAGTPEASGVDEHLAHEQPAHDAGHDVPHSDHIAHGEGHSHEPLSMVLPLALLALGAVFAGLLAWHHAIGGFLGHSPSFRTGFYYAQTHYAFADIPMWGQHAGPEYAAPAWHTYVMVLSILIAVLGILLAYLMHLKERARAERLAERYAGVARLLEAKYWVDEIYQAGIVEPLRRLGRGFFAVDRIVIDGIVATLGFAPQVAGFILRLTTQRGSLQGYALSMLGGIAVILLVLFFW